MKKGFTMFQKSLFFILVALILSGCFLNKPRRLKSPCIRSNGNISCELSPVNDHWLNKYKTS